MRNDKNVSILCVDARSESKKAVAVLRKAGVPFELWDAGKIKPGFGKPPFLLRGKQSYWGLTRIAGFAQTYPLLRRVERDLAAVRK